MTDISPACVDPSPRFRIGPIIRDIALVWGLTFLGGAIVGVATGGPSLDPQRFAMGIVVSNILLGVVAFAIIGCIAPPGRWRHLFAVAFGAWITSIVNVFISPITITQWLGGAVFLVVIMFVGGVISMAFRRETPLGPTKPVEPTGTSRFSLDLIASHASGESPSGSLRRWLLLPVGLLC